MIGAIADDFTGATDLASNLVRSGFRTVVVGSASAVAGVDLESTDAIVVALKSRTAPVAAAVEASLSALDSLRGAGASRYYFKYCSTFDSTDEGNIGPVLDALMQELGVATTIAVPSFPANGRTVYQGKLFVGSQLLSESPMKDHPLTPMRDADIPAVLSRQSRSDVRLIPWQSVQFGAGTLAELLDGGDGDTIIHVVDAVSNDDLATIAEGASQLTLVSGGSGLALGMKGPNPGASEATLAPMRHGARVILSGSASAATRAQVTAAMVSMPSRKVDLRQLRSDPTAEAALTLEWVARQWEVDPSASPIVYAVGEGDVVDAASAEHAASAAALERFFADIACDLVQRGARHLVVAGGETSGAVVTALGLEAMQFGREISPGIAWVTGPDRAGNRLNLALKSGNFGAVDFFSTAWGGLE